jgi:hypothetical protein
MSAAIEPLVASEIELLAGSAALARAIETGKAEDRAELRGPTS